MLKLIEKEKIIEWEIKHSSLAKKINSSVTYEQCRRYACEDISRRTRIQVDKKKFILEIPKGKEFHFIGRVDTSFRETCPSTYYQTFQCRKYVAFSTINNRNISRYKGGIFFIYNILPTDIVHIFSMDSDTNKMAVSEKELTVVPSLWLTLNELEELTEEMEVYNQITCKTKRKKHIIQPSAVIAFEKISEEIKKIAQEFQIGCIIVHPDENAINYQRDLLYDYKWLDSISYIMEKKYGLDVKSLAYDD